MSHFAKETRSRTELRSLSSWILRPPRSIASARESSRSDPPSRESTEIALSGSAFAGRSGSVRDGMISLRFIADKRITHKVRYRETTEHGYNPARSDGGGSR